MFFEGEDACCLWKRKVPRLGARGGGKWPGPAPVCVIHNEYIYIYIHYTSIFKSASNTYIYIYMCGCCLFKMSEVCGLFSMCGDCGDGV